MRTLWRTRWLRRSRTPKGWSPAAVGGRGGLRLPLVDAEKVGMDGVTLGVVRISIRRPCTWNSFDPPPSSPISAVAGRLPACLASLDSGTPCLLLSSVSHPPSITLRSADLYGGAASTTFLRARFCFGGEWLRTLDGEIGDLGFGWFEGNGREDALVSGGKG